MVLLLVILIIFGTSKLGDVGSLGKGIRDFKRAIDEPEGSSGAVVKSADAGTVGTIPDRKP